jgi:hypothetical protein
MYSSSQVNTRRRPAMSLSSQSTAIPDAGREMAQPVKQIVEGRYIDREKLISVLTETFGEGKFAVRVSR